MAQVGDIGGETRGVPPVLRVNRLRQSEIASVSRQMSGNLQIDHKTFKTPGVSRANDADA
jgi:hypothetical protein